MRILHSVPTYIPAYRYGGPIYAVHGLCKALAHLGHEVHVFTTNVDGDKDSDVPLEKPVDLDNVKIWYFPSKRLRRIYKSPQMKKALEKYISEFDIVHLHSIFLWPTWVAARAAYKAEKPYIISPRGMLVKDLIQRKSRWRKTTWINFIEKSNFKHAAAIHVTTKNEMEEAKKFEFYFPKIFIIPNGVDIDEFDIAMNNNEYTMNNSINLMNVDKYILFLGRINWKKGLDRLIPAMTFIPNIYLIIAGNDEEKYKHEIEALAVKYGVLERIRFIGPVYGNEKINLLKNAEMLVLPSYSENFGNVVLEAMAAGCPVVVTPEVGISDVVEKFKTGLVVNGRPEIFGKSIKSLLSNNGKCRDMGKRGRRTVQEHFRWPIIAKQMEEAYHRVLNDLGKNNEESI